MKFLFYKNQKFSTPWASTFKQLYREEFERRGIPIIEIDSTSEVSDTENSYLILCHKVELERYKKESANSIKTIMQSNGTSVNIWDFMIEPEEEIQDFNTVTYNLTASDIQTEAIKEAFGITNVYTVGFPIQKLQTSNNKQKGRYAIGGRLTPDKCVYSAIELALSDGAKEILVCYPQSQSEFVKYYPKKPFLQYRCCGEQEFLEVLGSCEKLAIASLGDTFSVVDVQARMLGLEVITTEQKDTGSPFPYYRSNGERMELFKVETCVDNLLKIIQDGNV